MRAPPRQICVRPLGRVQAGAGDVSLLSFFVLIDGVSSSDLNGLERSLHRQARRYLQTFQQLTVLNEPITPISS
jgi:hypothetical protein